ncbi:MAG TPA: efflux RND transporter periplasmic adaptor subunit [Vicinamibacterales bacterium]
MTRSTVKSFRYAAPALAVAGLALFTSGCGRTAASETPAAAPAAIEIGRENVIEVQRRQISVGPLISGELRAAQEATVRAEVGGAVLSVGPEEGQVVRKGAVLARIEGRALQDAYESAQSALRSAEQTYAWAQKEEARIRNLVQGGALAERDLEVATNAAVQARAAVDDARARVASARKALDDLTVVAPMTGIVSRRHVSAGDVVSPTSELYTIIDPSSMRLDASVPSEQIAAVRVGAPVIFQVRGYPGQTFEGRIERVSPAADPITRQVPIFVSIPNKEGRLIAGLFAEGRVTRESREALVVPLSAVNQTGDTPWVMRVRDAKAERVPVTLGLHDEQTEQVEIAQGVEAGDLLLVGAAQGMTPGTPVRFRTQQASK